MGSIGPRARLIHSELSIRRDEALELVRDERFLRFMQPDAPVHFRNGVLRSVLDDDELDPDIEAAVGTLPPQQQAAVRAVYGDGMTAVETADHMGISAGAVRFHLNQARSSLRPMLSPDTAHQEVPS